MSIINQGCRETNSQFFWIILHALRISLACPLSLHHVVASSNSAADADANAHDTVWHIPRDPKSKRSLLQYERKPNSANKCKPMGSQACWLGQVCVGEGASHNAIEK